MARSIVGKAFLAGIGWSQDASPIEDIRKDGRGNFYVQIRKSKLRLAEKRVLDKTKTDSKIDLPELGATTIKEPQVSERAGMTPAALTRIPQEWSLDQVEEELWSQNSQR